MCWYFVFQNLSCSFLGIKDDASFGLFKQKIQDEIDNAWSTPSINTDVTLNLPTSIKYLCFGNLTQPNRDPQYALQYDALRSYSSNFERQNTNTFLYPPEKAKSFSHTNTKHITLSEITNEFSCTPTKNGRATIHLQKGEFDSLVKISLRRT